MVVSTTSRAPASRELTALLSQIAGLPYLRAAARRGTSHRPLPALGPRRDPARTARRGGRRPRQRHPGSPPTQRRSAGRGRPCASWRAADSSIPTPTEQALSTLEWIARAENLAVARTFGHRQDPPGRGPGPRRDRHRPPGRLVHPGIPPPPPSGAPPPEPDPPPAPSPKSPERT